MAYDLLRGSTDFGFLFVLFYIDDLSLSLRMEQVLSEPGRGRCGIWRHSGSRLSHFGVCDLTCVTVAFP